MHEHPESRPSFFGETDDGGLTLAVGQALGVVPEADGGEALSLLGLDEKARVERVGAGDLAIATGERISLGAEETGNAALEGLPCFVWHDDLLTSDRPYRAWASCRCFSVNLSSPKTRYKTCSIRYIRRSIVLFFRKFYFPSFPFGREEHALCT